MIPLLQCNGPVKQTNKSNQWQILMNHQKKEKKSLILIIATLTEYMKYQQRLDQEKIDKAELRKNQREKNAKPKLNKIKTLTKSTKKE